MIKKWLFNDDPDFERDYNNLKALYEYYKANPGLISEQWILETAKELNARELAMKIKGTWKKGQ